MLVSHILDFFNSFARFFISCASMPDFEFASLIPQIQRSHRAF